MGRAYGPQKEPASGRQGLVVTRLLFVALLPLSMGTSVAAQTVSLVGDGEPRAVLVTGDKPTMTATYAATELAGHVKLATGVQLQIVSESEVPGGYDSHLFIGVTEAARSQGIQPEKLAPDEFVLRTMGNDLYVLGMEDPARVSVMTVRKGETNLDMKHRVLHGGYSVDRQTAPLGTLFGVHEVLQRYVGVLWLWPGELVLQRYEGFH